MKDAYPMSASEERDHHLTNPISRSVLRAEFYAKRCSSSVNHGLRRLEARISLTAAVWKVAYHLTERCPQRLSVFHGKLVAGGYVGTLAGSTLYENRRALG